MLSAGVDHLLISKSVSCLWKVQRKQQRCSGFRITQRHLIVSAELSEVLSKWKAALSWVKPCVCFETSSLSHPSCRLLLPRKSKSSLFFSSERTTQKSGLRNVKKLIFFKAFTASIIDHFGRHWLWGKKLWQPAMVVVEEWLPKGSLEVMERRIALDVEDTKSFTQSRQQVENRLLTWQGNRE